MKGDRREGGFTLLEVLLSLVIISVVFLALANANITGVRIWEKNTDKIQTQQIKRIISIHITPYIRMATGIDITYLPEALKISFLKCSYPADNLCIGMIYGIKPNGEFYYQKVFEGGSTGNQNSITSTDELKIKELIFNYHSTQKIIEISFIIETETLQERKIMERIYLRNSNIVISS